ncbi:MAG: ABC transporter substrate-binding protein [Desertimonas sp.]
MSASRRTLSLVTTAALAAVVLACDGGHDSAPSTTTATTITTVPVTIDDTPRPDGVLSIGLLVPTSGTGANIGQALVDGASRAINEVNAAGGVAGAQIEVVPADEGETTAQANAAIEALVDAGVDAVIGPVSSATALATLDQLVGDEVVTCSPTASAISLDTFPNRDLFVRTAPSDTLQAVGLATLAEQTGRRSVAVVWVDDAYGRPFARAIDEALRARPSMEVTAEVSFPSSGETGPALDELIAAEPGVVIVAAGTDLGWNLLSAYDAALRANPDLARPDIIVNDGMRVPPSSGVVAALAPDFRASIQGLSPMAFYTADPIQPFFANAYDCAMLIALAAIQVGPDDHRAMAGAISATSTDGASCITFDECRQVLAESLDVDYDGLSDFAIEIATDGDPARARYDQFRYDDAGVDMTERTITVNR